MATSSAAQTCNKPACAATKNKHKGKAFKRAFINLTSFDFHLLGWDLQVSSVPVEIPWNPDLFTHYLRSTAGLTSIVIPPAKSMRLSLLSAKKAIDRPS